MNWWRIYYDTGAVFTDKQGSPCDAPRTGVQVIVQSHPSAGYEIVQGGDFFYYEEDRRGWWYGDIFTAMDHLMRATRQCLLFGRMVPDDQFAQLIKRVNEECGPRAGRTTPEPVREAK